jgi:hypothetical protein
VETEHLPVEAQPVQTMPGRLVAATSRLLLPDGRMTGGSAWALLGAFAVTFLVLSLLGRLAGATNHLGSLPRWHPRVSPQTFYFPTASEEVARAIDGVRPDQIIVVIGGSSVMRGGMQGLDGLWSLQLQRELGERFRVVNVAQPSGQLTDHGGVVAQALYKSGRRVVLVSDLLGQQVPPPDGGVYRYVYWDAAYKGMLPENPRAEDRIAFWSTRNPTYRDDATELKLRATLDSQLRFADLWNTVGYTLLFGIWSPNNATVQGAFAPRREIPDFPTLQLPPLPTRFTSIPPADGQALIVSVGSTVCRQTGPETWVDDDHPEIWRERQADAEAAFPDEMKPHVVLIMTRFNPWFGQGLSADQRRCHERSYGVAESWMQQAGYPTTTIGMEWTDEDFADRLHLTSSGAAKMAHDVAPLVTARAEQLGYVDTP